jgi:hypothetical protein
LRTASPPRLWTFTAPLCRASGTTNLRVVALCSAIGTATPPTLSALTTARPLPLSVTVSPGAANFGLTDESFGAGTKVNSVSSPSFCLPRYTASFLPAIALAGTAPLMLPASTLRSVRSLPSSLTESPSAKPAPEIVIVAPAANCWGATAVTVGVTSPAFAGAGSPARAVAGLRLSAAGLATSSVKRASEPKVAAVVFVLEMRRSVNHTHGLSPLHAAAVKLLSAPSEPPR